MTKVLMIHPERCTGCKTCVLACVYSHEGEVRPTATRIHVYNWEREQFSVPMTCQQCDDAPCVTVCPTGAMHRSAGTILVEYDQNKCIRCRMCVQACPFGNATYDSVTNKILKCDTCAGAPECAKACPNGALEWVDESISTRSRKKAFAKKFKEAFQEVS